MGLDVTAPSIARQGSRVMWSLVRHRRRSGFWPSRSPASRLAFNCWLFDSLFRRRSSAPSRGPGVFGQTSSTDCQPASAAHSLRRNCAHPFTPQTLHITRDIVAGKKICGKNGLIIRLGAVARHGPERNVGVHGASKAKARCR